ncbi:MAG: hypothetical protein A3G41_02480 [Elusimicrobia bacterium RIFCSPLOWO2_12_FULL_59_9]|nr:MAG: hypothetical protein A3G41_02480 [Elusimicrobia bacterium RIFCSPLOWO2_12_FULL_59_9]
MAENQAQHRQNIEVKLVVSGLVNERIGAIGATIVSLGFLGGAVYSIASGYPAAGTFLGTLDILALVYAFRVGRT